MKTLLCNGKIYLERERFAEALLMENGVITKIGESKDLRNLLNSDDTVIDCQGKTVIPGLNDSHMHLLSLGESLETVRLQNSKSIDEIVERCRKFIAENPEISKNGVFAMGWNQDLFEGEKRIPNRFDVDRISTEIPVILRRVCGHLMVGNSKAIEMLGIDGNSPQFEGGTFEIGEDGYPNGVFTENACKKLRGVLKEYSLEDRKRMLIKAMDYAMSVGVTSVQSNDVGAVLLGDKEESLKMFREVFKNHSPKIRYHHQLTFLTVEDFKYWIEKGIFKGYGSEWETFGQLKIFKDGSLGARTALMEDEYQDDRGNFGEETHSDETTYEFCKLAEENDIQMLTHVIGDRAINKVVNAYKKVTQGNGNPQRHSLVHCQITTKEMLEDIAKNNIPVLYQPIFLDYDMHIVKSRCGEEKSSTSYAFRTLGGLGGKISYGSDAPVEDCNPFPNIYCAVTRKDLKGNPEGSFYGNECVDIYTAIDCYTLGSAYSQFMENKKGRIKEGFLADLVVLDRDIFTIDPNEIKDIKVSMTIVGGEVVFKR